MAAVMTSPLPLGGSLPDFKRPTYSPRLSTGQQSSDKRTSYHESSSVNTVASTAPTEPEPEPNSVVNPLFTASEAVKEGSLGEAHLQAGANGEFKLTEGPRTEAGRLSQWKPLKGTIDTVSSVAVSVGAPRLSQTGAGESNLGPPRTDPVPMRTLAKIPYENPQPDGAISPEPVDGAQVGDLQPIRGAAMQRANTLGSMHETALSQNLRPDASTSRISNSSPRGSAVKRTYSYDPNQILRSNPAGAGTVPPRQGSGDDFEDEIARQADVIRRERQSRRIEQEKVVLEKDKEKGKRRASGATIDPEQNVLVGNLIGEGHANYVMMYNMLTGIRIGVSRCQAKLKRPLTDEDYTARHKFSFDIVGNELTPSAKYDFKFKDYAPWVFRELREYFHLDPADYLLSLTAKYILSELGSPGKSGSFFYFSRDYRFIIKTIHHSEHKFLRKILKQYHEHVKKNPHSLLSRFYGLHRVKLPHGRKIHFVIMNNLFPPHRDVHETYDLKGSALGREYPEEKAATKKGAVLKDLNWVHRGRVIEVGPEKRALFEEQLRRDTELLQALGIMDYSLLIGMHDMGRGNRDKIRDDQLKVFQPEALKIRRPTQIRRDQEHAASALRKAVQQSDPKALSDQHRLPDKDRSERRHFIFYQDEGGFQATDDGDGELPTVYYLGIIDILTPYSTVKRIEHFWKGLSNDKHMISAVPPVEYGNRFLSFMFSIVRGADPSTRPKGLEPTPVPASPTAMSADESPEVAIGQAS